LFPIIYSSGYNITACGAEKMHPFDSTKYKRIWNFLHEGGKVPMEDFKFYHPNDLPSRKWLLEVMTPWYMFTHNYSIAVSKYVELPVCFLPAWLLRSQVLEPMILATKGSVEAAYMAVDQGWAINLAGGYHHANASSGEGFCVIPDITYVTKYIR
jgi:histone deacetylase 11